MTFSDEEKPALPLSEADKKLNEELSIRFFNTPPLYLGDLPLPTYQFTSKGPVPLKEEESK